MNKKIIYSLVGLALIFFVGSLVIFLRTNSDSKKKEKPVAVQEEISETEEQPLEMLSLKIFFLTRESRYMRPVPFEIEKPAVQQQLYNQFLALMLKGAENYIVPVPGGVSIRSTYYVPQKEMLVVDFSEDLILVFPAGTNSELEFIYFIVNNLCYNFPEIKKVKFMIAGNEYRILSGHLDIEHPFYPDYSHLYLKDE